MAAGKNPAPSSDAVQRGGAAQKESQGADGSASRGSFQASCSKYEEAYDFEQVLREELQAIDAAREDLPLLRRKPDDDSRAPAEADASRRRLFGLALSGGGIRSATFNLGLLQGISRLGLLRQVDYLSSVSGGGYIASWLHRWVHNRGLLEVEAALGSDSGQECPEVQWLRQRSNYLTPNTGAFGRDVALAAMSVARNLLLHLTLLASTIGVLLTMPWFLLWALSQESQITENPTLHGVTLDLRLAVGALALLLLTLAWTVSARRAAVESQPAPEGPASDGQRPKTAGRLSLDALGWARITEGLSVAALMVTSLALVLREPSSGGATHETWWWLSVLSGVAVVASLNAGFLSAGARRRESRSRPVQRILSSIGGGFVFGGLLWLLRQGVISGTAVSDAVPCMAGSGCHRMASVTLVPFALAGALVVAHIVHLGLGGRGYPERARAFWSRHWGRVLLYAGLWSTFCAAALLGPYVTQFGPEAVIPAFLAWATGSGSGLLAASRDAPGRTGKVLAAAAPYVFLTGFVLIVSWAVLRGALLIVDVQITATDFTTWSNIVATLSPPQILKVGLGWLGLLAAALLLGATLDVNVFSLHMFYRRRLEDCYLGYRGPDGASTDPRLADLEDNGLGQRPFPLLNATINLACTGDLSRQERKAGSFVFTPQHCGYTLFDGRPLYQPTREFLSIKGDLDLGTAMTISGAAVSPAAGAHTNGPTAALLALFNMRLGWWFQNTKSKASWVTTGPHFSPFYLAKEFLSRTDERGNFVYLSDGGHFDNLGLYELVRRRCRYIIVSDAGCDGEGRFADLGEVIRRCRIDFGADIEINPRPTTRNGAEWSTSHCVTGVIRYRKAEKGEHTETGYLLYIKASLTGEESSDILEFRQRNPSFPHDTTADQWFSESQFESYRALGQHIALSALKDARRDERENRTRRNSTLSPVLAKALSLSRGHREVDDGKSHGKPKAPEPCDCETLFERLAERWEPELERKSDDFDARWQQLQNQLRSDQQLAFLDAQLCPEWWDMEKRVDRGARKGSVTMLPATQAEARAGFYFCSALIDLAESGYHAFDLERCHALGAHRGTMNLLRQWAGSGMFQLTWALTVSTHGARFQRFGERELGLGQGRLNIGNWRLVRHVIAEKLGTWEYPNSEEMAVLERLRDSQAVGESAPVWPHLYCAPVVLSVQDRQNRVATEHDPHLLALPRPESPAVSWVVGMAVLTWDRDEGPRLYYLRVRDHVRKMGLGRRALEALWRENWQFRPADPEVLNAITSAAGRDALRRLWQNVSAAMPGRWIERGEERLEEYKRASKTSPQAAQYLDEAAAAYERALHHQSDNEEAIRGLARVLRERAFAHQEIARVPNSHAQAPSTSESRALRNPLQTAAELLEWALQDNPAAPYMRYNLACYYALLVKHYERSDLRQKALDHLQVALIQCPPFLDYAKTDEDLDGLLDEEAAAHILIVNVS